MYAIFDTHIIVVLNNLSYVSEIGKNSTGGYFLNNQIENMQGGHVITVPDLPQILICMKIIGLKNRYNPLLIIRLFPLLDRL